MKNDNLVRRHYRFLGHVQGVGFRYTVSRAADRYKVTGWARNEYDGSVTVELQGAPEQIDMVIQVIQSARYIAISRAFCDTVEVDPKEKRFSVRY